MKILAENEGRVFVAVAIIEPGDLQGPFPGSVFPCLIWDHSGSFGHSRRTAVVGRLLDADCRYAVCGGLNCEAWHDAVDAELVARHLDDTDEVLAASHVITTWHAEESPDEVAFFFVRNTNFDAHDFKHFLVLHIGESSKMSEVNDAVRRYALDQETD